MVLGTPNKPVMGSSEPSEPAGDGRERAQGVQLSVFTHEAARTQRRKGTWPVNHSKFVAEAGPEPWAQAPIQGCFLALSSPGWREAASGPRLRGGCTQRGRIHVDGSETELSAGSLPDTRITPGWLRDGLRE